MRRKFLISAAVAASFVALTCYAAVTTITGSRVLAKFAKEMHDENAVIVCSDSSASALPAGIVTNINKEVGAVTKSGTITVQVDSFVQAIELQIVSLTDTNSVTALCVTGIVITSASASTNVVDTIAIVGGGAVVTNIVNQVTP